VIDEHLVWESFEKRRSPQSGHLFLNVAPHVFYGEISFGCWH
jgi:hypothetical protein